MQKTVYLFDLDGTLCESTKCWSSHQHPEVAPDVYVCRYRLLDMKKTIEKLLTDNKGDLT